MCYAFKQRSYFCIYVFELDISLYLFVTILCVHGSSWMYIIMIVVYLETYTHDNNYMSYWYPNGSVSHPFIGIFSYCSTTSCSKCYASFYFMLTCTCFVFWTNMGELWFNFCALCIQNAIFLNHAQILGSSSFFVKNNTLIFSNHSIYFRLVCRIFLIACFSFGEDLRFCIPGY